MLEATSRPLRHTAIELGGAGGGEIRAALARALGDPALAVAFPDGEGAWLDPVGRPCAVPREHVREIRDGETLVAVLGATAAFGSDVRERLTEVLRLGGENARLRRSVTGQLAELDASRRRLLEAGDNERRQLEALLRRGALARLAAIAEELAAAPGLERPLAQVAVTRNELEDIAHGLDPLARGTPLSVALDELAARSPNQVDVDVAGGPFAEDAERTIWFACAEAVANASKHAPGAPISITVGPEAGGVLATIADDGPGGADPTGSGLHGLADRASVLGGSLAVDSEFGLGTRIVLRLPAGRSGQLVHPARAVADATAGLAP
jgi:signal transduction histidine kinase